MTIYLSFILYIIWMQWFIRQLLGCQAVCENENITTYNNKI